MAKRYNQQTQKFEELNKEYSAARATNDYYRRKQKYIEYYNKQLQEQLNQDELLLTLIAQKADAAVKLQAAQQTQLQASQQAALTGTHAPSARSEQAAAAGQRAVLSDLLWGYAAAGAGLAATLATAFTAPLPGGGALHLLLGIPAGLVTLFSLVGGYKLVGRRKTKKVKGLWRQVVALAPGAPFEPQDGFELWLPDRRQERGDDGERVVFSARRCRWQNGSWRLVKPIVPLEEDIKLHHGPELKTVWPADAELVEIAEAWADFVHALVELNTQPESEPQGESVAEPALQVADLLELPAPLPAEAPAAKPETHLTPVKMAK